MSAGDTGELSGHKGLGGEEDRNLKLKSRFKLDDNMGNGDRGTPSCIFKVTVLWENLRSKHPMVCKIEVSRGP